MGELGQAILTAVGIIAVSVLLNWVVQFVLDRFIEKLTGRTQTRLDDVLVDTIRLPLRILIVTLGVNLAIRALYFVPTSWYLIIDRIFFLIYNVIAFIFIYRLIGGLIHWYGQEVTHLTETDIDDRFLELFRRIAMIALTLIIAIIVLSRYGVEVSAMVTTLGIGSLAVALAAQEGLSDIFAGFTIMIDQPFRVGDRIEIHDIDAWGDVVDIGVRSTRICTQDNRMVSVPNSIIGKNLIVNHSFPNAMVRIETMVGVAYGSNIEEVRNAIISALAVEDWVLTHEPIEALFLEMADSALNFRVRCWIESYHDFWRVKDRLNTVVYEALTEANIPIPFPQRDLHIVSVAPEVKVGR